MMFFFLVSSIILIKNSMAATNGILDGLENLKRDIVFLKEQSSSIKTSIPKLALNISEAIQMDPLVTLEREKLVAAKEHGDLVDQCEEIFNSQYHYVIDKVHEYASNKITEELDNVEDNLRLIEKNVDNYIDRLKSGELSQDEINEIIHESDVDLSIVGRLLHVLPLLPQNTLYDLDREPASEIIHDNLHKPVFECLEESKITEFHETKNLE